MFLCAAWLFALAAMPCLAGGPYTPDADTVFLYHLDDSPGDTNTTNAGTLGNTSIAFDGNPITNPATIDINGTILGATGLTGFGNAANLSTVDKAIGYDANNNGQLETDPASTDDFVTMSSLVGSNGAFTLEAMINVSGPLNVTREILSTDSSINPRAFFFRLDNQGGLRFRMISDMPGGVEAPVPTTGFHAFVPNAWFHAAYVYDGEGTAKLYWTKVDPTVTAANLIGTFTLDDQNNSIPDLNGSVTGPLVIGNEQRQDSGNSLRGMIDEVRISSTARQDNEFIFPLATPIALPTLTVNRITGAMTLTNTGNTALDLRGYSITSTLGALDPDNWMPITGNYDVDGNGSVDNDDAWTILTNTDDNVTYMDLTENEPNGDGGTVGAGQSVQLSLGGAWIPSPQENDLLMQLTLAGAQDGSVIEIPVVYEGNGGVPLLRSDLNHDGNITVADWIILRDNNLVDLSALTDAQRYVLGDIDQDGDNDIDDYSQFVLDFEAANGGGSFATMLASVPEPSSIVLLGLAASCGLFFAARRPQGRNLRMLSKMNRQALSVALVTGATLFGLTVTRCKAVGPYTADANTVHLYHFDESSGATSTPNLGTAGNTAIAFDGDPLIDPAPVDTAILGATGLGGFGNAADVYDVDKGLGYDASGDGLLQRDTNDTDFITNSTLTGANGAFTLEAMINLEGGLGNSVTREIMSTDQSSLSRSFFFRISSADTIRFRSISDGPSVEVPVPTTGPHAFATDTWFHVAFAYDGEGTGSFYWTRMDSGATSANLVGTVPYSDITGTLEGPLVLGNEGRLDSGFGLQGLLDEVRISDVARGPNDFVFSNAASAFIALVQPASGEIRLINKTLDPIEFDSYQLTSDGNDTLNPSGWNSLSDQNLDPVDGGDDDGETWDEVGGASAAALAEQFLLGSTTVDPGEWVTLGTAYDASAGGTFSFRYHDTALGTTNNGLIETVLLGDMNGDGNVDEQDVPLFVQALVNRGAYNSTYPDIDADFVGDFDGNGLLDFGDLGDFSTEVASASASSSAVPEPSTGVLVSLTLGLFALLGCRSR